MIHDRPGPATRHPQLRLLHHRLALDPLDPAFVVELDSAEDQAAGLPRDRGCLGDIFLSRDVAEWFILECIGRRFWAVYGQTRPP